MKTLFWTRVNVMLTITRRFFLITLLTSATLFASTPSYAAMSSGQAAASAQSRHGGKVLNVRKVSSKDGKTTYKVKLLLKGGRVKTITVSG